MIIGRSGAARIDGNALLLAVFYDALVKTGCNNEFCTRRKRFVNLGENRACAYKHFGHIFAYELYCFFCSRRAEGNLCNGNSARTKSLCKGNGVTLGMVELDNGHNAY